MNAQQSSKRHYGSLRELLDNLQEQGVDLSTLGPPEPLPPVPTKEERVSMRKSLRAERKQLDEERRIRFEQRQAAVWGNRKNEETRCFIVTKQQRYDLYSGSVGPGWWSLLDRYVDEILELDPDAEIFLKEKFGTARVDVMSANVSCRKIQNIVDPVESESSRVCECCGASGKIRRDRGWYRVLCDRCNALDHAAKERICAETERIWLEENG